MKMKSVSILLFSIILPLLVVIILAIVGITFSTWVYALLFLYVWLLQVSYGSFIKIWRKKCRKRSEDIHSHGVADW
jgi:hypothetical protein